MVCLEKCVEERLVPKGFDLGEKRFNLRRDCRDEVSLNLISIEVKRLKEKLLTLKIQYRNNLFKLKHKQMSHLKT